MPSTLGTRATNGVSRNGSARAVSGASLGSHLPRSDMSTCTTRHAPFFHPPSAYMGNSIAITKIIFPTDRLAEFRSSWERARASLLAHMLVCSHVARRKSTNYPRKGLQTCQLQQFHCNSKGKLCSTVRFPQLKREKKL